MANPFPQIRPLDLPGMVNVGSPDFRPLGEIGDTLAAARRKAQIAEIMQGATGPNGQIDVERAGTLLAQIGEDPRAMLALAQQKASMAQAGGRHADSVRLQQERIALDRAQLEEGKLPPGAMRDPNNPGGIIPRPGYIDLLRQTSEARTPPGALLDDETLKPLAEQARAGDTSVFTNIGRGAQGSENLIRLRREIARQNAEAGTGGAEQAARNAEFFGEKAGQRTLGTRSANIELPAAEFQQMAPLALQASEAVDRTQYPNLNAITNAVQKGTGGEAIVRFNAANNTLVNVYSRAVSPTGVPTDALRQHAYDLLNTGFSKGQYSAVVDMMHQEIAAARRSPGSVRQQMRENFTGQQSSPELGGPGALKQFKSPTDVNIAVQKGILRSGDTFLDTNGTRRRVP